MTDPDRTGAFQPDGPGSPAADPGNVLPTFIGRYRVERVLGKGGFGLVYLANDGRLQRLVAVKVPHRRLVDRPDAAEAYLTEARTVANLDHPNIAPVYDAGSAEDCPCFIVSKYIDGTDLATRLRQSRPPLHESVELVATVAEALHYAHKQGLVHRDVKPGNLLLDERGRPFVTDFGLALRDQDVGRGPRYAGTPAYMSPEQARGEGHRVDGRSDVFSLGVVFYELMVGRPPFRAESQAELLDLVASSEARPPRQYDDVIPKELDRICLKALSKRAADRYSTAKDLADDLRHFLAEQPAAKRGGPAWVTQVAPTPSTAGGSCAAVTPVSPTSDHRPIKIVPKGLRSFDAHDADFFLELLPGPRGRDGLPDSLRFWKARIEEADSDATFAVGLIYGPSGCGKTSLVKAGLLPRLAGGVIPVYVEATAGETEARLLNGLRKRCPALPHDMGLKDAISALRRGLGVPAGKKVVVVLDQFEQWLHARKDAQDAELVQALRQCDGGRVQCVVMVRDDFWMAATRFMRELEVRLAEGQNSAAVDLFPVRHAEKVLAAFGRAFGVLPDAAADAGKDHKSFLEQAAAGLALEGKVVCVRLSLFAEMMKGKPWTPTSLRAVGGTEGVGAAFLEETFSAATAPPEHRYHQKAARGVLKALLPDSGTDIKGHMRSHGELLDASGYAKRPGDFDDLIRVLDGDIRLITPTDPGDTEGASAPPEPGQKYFQLTHDYLVPSLREWLTRKQKETRRGRAELLLADRTAVWSARQENRQLPSLWQWLGIRWLTAKANWTPPQMKMMATAGRVHAVRGLATGLCLAVATLAGLAIRERVIEQREATRAAGVVQALLNADTSQVPAIVGEMAGYRKWTDAVLREEYDKSGANSRQRLHTSLALLPVDPTQVAYLYGRLLDAEPHELPVIRDSLEPHKDAVRDELWAVAERPGEGQEPQRLRAAAALAKYDPDGERWVKAAGPVVDRLVAENPVYLGHWVEDFRPCKGNLMAALAGVYRDTTRRESERSVATSVLADYAADRPRVLAELLMDADEKQFAVIYPKLKDRGGDCLPALAGEIDKSLPPDLPSSDERRDVLAKRQANAAVALLRMDGPARVWPLLRHGPDPRVRSYLAHRLSLLGADPKAVVKQLEVEQDATVRRALLLALGEFGEKAATPDTLRSILPKVREEYRTASDPGIHAAAEWLLRQWKQDDWLARVNDAWAGDGANREKKIAAVKESAAKEKAPAPPQWYVNSQGQTFVVIPGPVEFEMGSPPTEAGRQENETRHRKRIGRTVAVAAKLVTVGQYRRSDAEYWAPAVFTRSADLPAVGITWFKAAMYCNWLSEAEGIGRDQWCYETKGGEVRMKDHYLSRGGYRLPTEAEMEYATRAGSATSRYYGETDDLLGKYAWYSRNSHERTQPVGVMKPNDLGLFDAMGNANVQCQERYQHARNADEPLDDRERELEVTSDHSRVLRGQAYNDRSEFIRSAYRYGVRPINQYYQVGIRPVRTIAP